MAKKRIGNQTPTQSLILSTRNSQYKEAVFLYEQTGRKPAKWQTDLLKAMLSQTKKGLWTHTKFGYSLPRRNGKNEIIAICEMYGLEKGEQILHTAHRTTTSHSAWERLCSLLDKAQIPYKALRANGRERIDVESGGKVEFRTRTSTGGLGEGFDLLIIDEAQEYTTDQESALKYVVTDSENPHTILCGTPPTPISSGSVFTDLRKKALYGETENTGWAEWSVENESDVHDKELWYLTNPSLGIVFTERAVSDEIGSDPIDFNIQRLGLWIKYNQKSAISITDWESVKVDRLPKFKGRLYAGIKYARDGGNVALSIAVKTEDNQIFVESIDCRPARSGNEWIITFLQQADIGEVAIDGASGQTLLAGEMKERGLKKPILPTVKEIITANAMFENAIYQKTLCHKAQPSLTEVVSNCEKRNIGSGGGFGFSAQYTENEIALMDSCLIAHWLCAEAKEPVKQKIWY